MPFYNIDNLIELLPAEAKIINNTLQISFENVKAVTDADENSLVWISPNKPDKVNTAIQTKSKIIICDFSFEFLNDERLASKCLVMVNDPRLIFLRIVDALFAFEVKWGIHPSSTIDSSATIHPESHIGPNCYVGNSSIGKGTIIHGNCFIYDQVQIGENVTIKPGVVIGGDGFGYQRNEANELEKFPHRGGVIIEDRVDIGANTCIDRGTLGNTHIKTGAKIDNLVHIAHNVIVGRHAAVIALAVVGGSTVIEDYAWIAPGACLREGVTIGQNSIVGLGSVVTKSVPSNETWAGNPARIFSK